MASSTTRPTAIAIALRVSRLTVNPQRRIARKPIRTLNGMEIAVISEARKAIRNTKITIIARIAPTIASR
jgi:hypothetical protein